MSLQQGLLPHLGETCTSFFQPISESLLCVPLCLCVSEPRIPRPTEIHYAVRHTAVSVTPLRRLMVETRSL